MNVTTKEETIRRFVHPFLRVRSDVRRIQRRERPLASYSTASLIIISHHDAKGALSQARPDQSWLAPPLRDRDAANKRRGRSFCSLNIRRYSFRGHALQIALNSLPKLHPFALIGSVGFERHDVSRPALRHLKPIRLVEEEDRGQHAATNDKIVSVIWPGTGDAPPHLFQRSCAIRFAKRFPRQRARQVIRVGEDPETRDVIMRRVQFEKEQLARFEGSKRSGPRRPKIYFSQMRLRAQMLEPVAIGDGDDELDGHAML